MTLILQEVNKLTRGSENKNIMMNLFLVHYTVDKKPYTDNPRTSFILARNKHSIKEVLDRYFEVENKYQIRVSLVTQYDINKEQILF